MLYRLTATVKNLRRGAMIVATDVTWVSVWVAVVVPALVRALADGTPPWLALAPVRRPPDLPLDAIPLALRAIQIGAGCAADYDQWLGGVA
jgi:hypothetical protein